jgi:hypothetical protein
MVGVFAVNCAYQVFRKPGELLAPISASFSKNAHSTWKTYGALFERHSTSVLSAEFLAALAHVESSGNPIASPDWRWQWTWNPLEIYRPASSALGMFQITDARFDEAQKYCIRDHQVLIEGPRHDPRSCWFNGFYLRTIPSHASEMTAAYLHQSVAKLLALHKPKKVKPVQKERLAAVVHLCGLSRGESFVKRGFRIAAGERCGTHDLARYIEQIERMKKTFARLRANA